MNNITTLQEACTFRGYNLDDEIPFSEPKNDRQIAVNSFAGTLVVVEAINADPDGTKWIPNFDTSERKYEVWWNMRTEAAGGPGFSCGDDDCDDSYSYVGARLVFRSEAHGRYFAQNFPDLASGWMVIPKE